MTGFLLIVLAFTCAGLLAWGFKKPERIYQYPFLAGAVFTGWVFPQLLGLSNASWLPPGSLNKTIIMTTLCAAACFFGHAHCKQPLRIWYLCFNRRRLLIASIGLSLIGAYFFYQVGLLSEEVTAEHGGAWTGPITIYMFFASMLTVGMVLAIGCYFAKPTVSSLAIVLFDLLFYLNRIFLQGRRAAMAELFIIAGLAFWFHRGKVLARPILAILLFGGALIVNSIADYRYAIIGVDAVGINAVPRIDFIGNMQRLWTGGGYELTNAAYTIEAVDRRMDYDFGASHWNGFVKAYIPGQILGADFKGSLLIPLDAAYREFSYVSYTGTTYTGMSDAFASFWYFGAIKFFIIAFVMAKLYRSALHGHLVSQILLMLIFRGALEAITHTTDRFFMEWIKWAAFLFPALWYARVRLKLYPDMAVSQANLQRG